MVIPVEGRSFATWGWQLIVGALFDHQAELAGTQTRDQISPDARNLTVGTLTRLFVPVIWLSSSDGCIPHPFPIRTVMSQFGLGKKDAWS